MGTLSQGVPWSIEDLITLSILKRLQANEVLAAKFGAQIVRCAVAYPSSTDVKPRLVVAPSLVTEERELSRHNEVTFRVTIMIETEEFMETLDDNEPSVISLLSLARNAAESGPPYVVSSPGGPRSGAKIHLPNPQDPTEALTVKALKWQPIPGIPNNYGGMPNLFYIGQDCITTFKSSSEDRSNALHA